MKNIIIPFLLLTVLGCTDLGDGKFYKYTIRNKSGKTITIKGYNPYYPDKLSVITIKNGEEKTKTYQDKLPPSSYNYGDFFGDGVAEGKERVDSLRIIYNNSKIQVFNTEWSKNARNPLNTCIYNETE